MNEHLALQSILYCMNIYYYRHHHVCSVFREERRGRAQFLKSGYTHTLKWVSLLFLLGQNNEAFIVYKHIQLAHTQRARERRVVSTCLWRREMSTFISRVARAVERQGTGCCVSCCCHGSLTHHPLLFQLYSARCYYRISGTVDNNNSRVNIRGPLIISAPR